MPRTQEIAQTSADLPLIYISSGILFLNFKSTLKVHHPTDGVKGVNTNSNIEKNISKDSTLNQLKLCTRPKTPTAGT